MGLCDACNMDKLKEQEEKILKEKVDKLCGADCFPCCKVCACEIGKKMWCACHRKQLFNAIQEALQSQRELIREMAEEIIQKERFAGAPHALNELIDKLK